MGRRGGTPQGGDELSGRGQRLLDAWDPLGLGAPPGEYDRLAGQALGALYRGASHAQLTALLHAEVGEFGDGPDAAAVLAADLLHWFERTSAEPPPPPA